MRVQIVFQSFRHLAYIFVPVCWRIVGTMIAFCRHSLIGTYCVVNFIQQLSSPYSPRYSFCGTLLALRYTGDLETCKTDAVEYTYMRARREFRDRPDVEVAVLDALVDRADEGMTVFEIRAAVEADIDTIEDALAALKSDDLIRVDDGDDRVVIRAADRVIPDPDAEIDTDKSFVDTLRERLGL